MFVRFRPAFYIFIIIEGALIEKGSTQECSSIPQIRSINSDFIGSSVSVSQLLNIADEIAHTDAPVLITGECGTGKDILARRIHAQSRRSDAPYIPVNCGAIVGSLEESELFGYLPGAFTGASKRKQGYFEAADQGTLFLDEIGEASPGLQVKLLRVLQDGDYAPIGSTRMLRCDVRVIAATNVDLGNAVDEGAFRADLYYRLDVVRLHIPPLRERMEDIPLLIRHFVKRYAKTYGLSHPPEIHPDFYEKLMQPVYPGNVRELSNYVHRAVVMCGGRSLTAALLERYQIGGSQAVPSLTHTSRKESIQAELGAAPVSPVSKTAFHEAKKSLIETFEREYLVAVLTECSGIIYRAAKRAGLSERAFHQKLRQYGIDGTRFRETE